MFRVGILGAENSHAMAFGQIFNGIRDDLKDEFDDIQVTAVGGHYPEANREVYEKCGLELLADSPEEMQGKVDAIMVTARDGKYHAGFARPFIEAGLPAFVDKPFTSDPEEALALAKLAKKKGVPLAGGSSLKLCADVLKAAQVVEENGDNVLSGDVTAPVSMINEYGGFWFYSAHLAEICLRIFGYNPEWVWANRTDNGVTAIVHYPKYDVTLHFTQNAYHYSATINTKDVIVHQPIDITDFSVIEARSFAKMLRCGEMDFSYEQLVLPVFMLKAIEKSFETGEKQVIPKVEI